jgi:hypothetical protein
MLEVRFGDHDKVVFPEDAVGNGVVLEISEKRPFSHETPTHLDDTFVQLGSPGLYRVILRPKERPFLDPPHELWLDIAATSADDQPASAQGKRRLQRRAMKTAST